MNVTSIVLTSILSAIFVGALVLAHESAIIFQETLMEVSINASKRAINASIITKGIDPIALNEFKEITNPQENLFIRKHNQDDHAISQLVGEFEDETIAAVGFSVNKYYTAESFVHKSLNAPTFRYSGLLIEDWFDMSNLVIPADANPSGTYYRYSLDSTDPSNESSIWDNTTFTPGNIPQTMSVRSYHVDEIYHPSGVVKVTFQMPVPELLTLREDGSSNSGVSFWEVKNSYNKIILKSKTNNSLFDIYYCFNNSSNWTLYSEPFHAGFEFWSKDGVQLNVKIKPKSAYFDKVYYETIALRITKHKLANPTFDPSPNEEIIQGDSVEILNPNKESHSRFGEIQYERTGSGFAETIKIQIEP